MKQCKRRGREGLFADNLHFGLQINALFFAHSLTNQLKEGDHVCGGGVTDVNNEIAMQLRVSLSIQLPLDDSSLLPVHADTWTGVSPFETVVWLPLVNCYKTKSMAMKEEYRLKKNKKIRNKLKNRFKINLK